MTEKRNKKEEKEEKGFISEPGKGSDESGL